MRFQHSFVIAVGLWFVTAAGMVQGQYEAVTEADIPKLQLSHYFTPDKKGHMADFAWTFTKDEFVVAKGTAAIPADLLKRLVPTGTAAEEIRGKWKLESKGSVQLVLTDILVSDDKGGETLGNREAKLVIYRTAPTVVRIGEVQYVFAIQ
jgi:hypothetical protein